MTSFFKTLLTTGAVFGVIIGSLACIVISILFGLDRGIMVGAAIALSTSFIFGLIMALFMAFQRKDFSRQNLELPGEVLLRDGPANHFRNGEGVGGWLYLTDQRVLFRSHKFNIQPHEWSMPLTNITNVQTVLTFGIIPNGLRLSAQSGQIEKFVVEGNRRWREQIFSAQTRAG